MDKLVAQNNQIVLPVDYPFLEDVMRMNISTRTSKRTKRVNDGLIRQKMTVIVEQEYIPLGYSRMYQNQEVLLSLSPYACVILVYIGCKLHFDQQKIQMSAKDTKISPRTFANAIAELESARIIKKEKRETYWVNISIIIVGPDPALPHSLDMHANGT